MDNNDFISKMVEETLGQELDQDEAVLKFEQPECFELQATYLPSKKCFQIMANGRTIEIPKNWGPFKNRIANEFVLSHHDDKDELIPVISAFLGKPLDCLKVKLLKSEHNLEEYSSAA